jgi:hypothetical protein
MVALCSSIVLLLVVLLGVLRTILERSFPFVRKFSDETRQAFIILALAAAGLFAWSRLDLHVESVEFAGVKASVGKLQQRVETLSDQMEVFFKRKRIEEFSRRNWDRVRMVGRSKNGVVLEVTLEQEPIAGSVEVLEGALPMPEQEYQVRGRVVRFPANTDKPTIGLTIKYYPRLLTPQQ